MMNNAQLDNEKQTYRYQVDLLKDQLEEMEEQLIELQRQHKDRCRVSFFPALTCFRKRSCYILKDFIDWKLVNGELFKTITSFDLYLIYI